MDALQPPPIEAPRPTPRQCGPAFEPPLDDVSLIFVLASALDELVSLNELMTDKNRHTAPEGSPLRECGQALERFGEWVRAGTDADPKFLEGRGS